MNIKFISIVSVIIVLSSFMPCFAQTHEGLRKLCERYWDRRMEEFPTTATAIGDYRFNDKLEDVSAEGRQRWRQSLEGFLKETKALSGQTLNDDDRLTRELLERTLADEVVKIDSQQNDFPLEPLDGPHLSFPLILVSQPFRNAEDFRAYVRRLNGFPKQIKTYIESMRATTTRGRVPPRVIIEKVIPQIRGQILDDPTKSEFYKPVRVMDTLSERDRKELTEWIDDAIRTSVMPAYKELLKFVEEEYLPVSRPSVGLGAIPGGDLDYARLMYWHMTYKADPEAIHKLGLSEVERIRGEMGAVQKSMGKEGSLDDFLTHMRSDPKYRFKTGEELYKAADGYLQWAKSQMPKLFNRLPKADCVMKEVEGFRAPAAPVAYYNAPPEDGSRPGYYYINLYQPEERLRFTLEALSYHEAVPGHHLQMALHQESKNLPRFQRYASFTAYVEGWALYTEKLGYEIGGYKTHEERFGQLTFEMWRACRLVVDTGMHHKGWSRQQAVDFMRKNTSLADLDIASEIDRYISWPGQALAYKTGELRILDMRKNAEKTLGAKFDLRAFHDALLKDGAMPIDILEQRMQAWVKSQM